MDDKREYEKFLTEQQNPASARLDLMNNREIVELFLDEEKRVDAALRSAEKKLAEGIDIVARAYAKGRIFMLGAGTSGRLGVLEAAECPPTFGSDPNKILALMAGGKNAVFLSKEGAEDDPASAGAALLDYNCNENDLVLGIAASGLTPFVQGALKFAREIDSETILITCNPSCVPSNCAKLVIGLPVGPEILTGSTRLKAGTATKRALNILTTGAMVRAGKVYGNLMVDLKASSDKLSARATRIVAILGDVDKKTAKNLLMRSGGSTKTAIIMTRLSVERSKAEQLLDEADGFLRQVLGEK